MILTRQPWWRAWHGAKTSPCYIWDPEPRNTHRDHSRSSLHVLPHRAPSQTQTSEASRESTILTTITHHCTAHSLTRRRVASSASRWSERCAWDSQCVRGIERGRELRAEQNSPSRSARWDDETGDALTGDAGNLTIAETAKSAKAFTIPAGPALSHTPSRPGR